MPEEPNDTIRTMKTDMEELLLNEKTSLADLIARTGRANYERGYNPPPQTNVLRIALIALGGVVIIGLIGLGIYFYVQSKRPLVPAHQEVSVPKAFLAVARTESAEVRSGDRTDLIGALRNAGKKNTSDGEFVYVPLVLYDGGGKKHAASPEEFFELAQMKPPEDFLSNLTGRWNIYTIAGSPVFVFEIKDWLRAKGVAFRWEDASLIEDFSPFMVLTSRGGTWHFEDLTLLNEDARFVQLSTSTQSVLGYSFPLHKFFIVALSRTALDRTLERMIAGPVYY